MSDVILILVGAGLVIAGLAVAGSGHKQTVRVGNWGLSIFGSVRQNFQSVGLVIRGERQKTARDWIGLGLSVGGLIVGLVGLVRS